MSCVGSYTSNLPWKNYAPDVAVYLGALDVAALSLRSIDGPWMAAVYPLALVNIVVTRSFCGSTRNEL